MDINILAQALTITNNDVERKNNEAFLDKIKQAKSQQNFAPFLLKITCNTQYPSETQLNASIQLKNFVAQFWKFGTNENMNKSLCFEDNEKIIIIPQEDKEFIRSNILDALVCSIKSEKLLKQLNQVIYKIGKLEFQKVWKEQFLSKIIEFFKSMDDGKIYAGVIAFFQISKIFEFESGDYKADYNTSLDLINSYLLVFLNNLYGSLSNPHAAYIYYKILKIFFKSIQLGASKLLFEEKNFESWSMFTIAAIRFNVPPEYVKKTQLTEEMNTLNRNIFWKLKKLCFQLIYRIYHKYGNLENLENDNLKPFCKLINCVYLKVYYEVSLEYLAISKTQFVSEYIMCIIYKLLSHMITRNHMIPEIESRLDIILKDYMVQNVMMTLQDFDLWRDDPKTYILKQFDITESYYNLRYSVCQFVKTICSYKKKNEKGKYIKKPPYFEVVYKYLISILDIYESQVLAGNSPDVRIKEGVLYIIQAISNIVIIQSPDSIEKLIEVYVLKEFESGYGILRERASSFIESFEDFKFTNSGLLQEITKKICYILDNETGLPVKVMAAISAPVLLKNEGIKELLNDHVPKLLEIYLNLINTIDLEEILEGLESIISRFNHRVKDYAVALTVELVKIFNRLIKEEEGEDDKGEKALVEDGVLRTLLKIIELFVNDDIIFPKIEEIVEPIITWGLKEENLDKIDDILDIIDVIVRRGNKISPKSWNYFSEIIFTIIGSEEDLKQFQKDHPGIEYEGLGYDNISDIIPILSNYVTKDPLMFLNSCDKFNVPFLSRSISLIQKIISISKANHDNNNIRQALKFLNVIIDTLKGKIDNVVEEIIAFLINELKDGGDKKNSIIFTLVETIASCVLYNPLLTIKSIERNNYIENLFQTWISLIPKMKKSEQRRTLMAFTSILLIDPQNLNTIIINNISMILKQIVKLVEEVEKTLSKENQKNEEVEEESFEEEENEEKRDKLLNSYFQKAHKAMNNDNDDDFLEEDEDDEEWDEFSDMKGMTIVDKQDEILYVKEVLAHLSTNNSTYYNQIMNLLDVQSKYILESSIVNAEKRAIEKAKSN